MKIKLFIIAFVITNMAIAQTKVSLTDKISFNLPEGTVKYQDQQYVKDIENELGKDGLKILTQNMLSYKAQDVVFKFRLVKKIGKSPIQRVAESMDNIYSDRSHKIYQKNSLYDDYKREIKTVNGNEIVFSSFKFKTNFIIMFYCYNSVQQTAFSGEITSDEKDKKNVAKILDNLINSINIK
jgi:hypothetical protein